MNLPLSSSVNPAFLLLVLGFFKSISSCATFKSPQTTTGFFFSKFFRYFYPNLEQVYSWWSYRGRARENNAGWRIDYFVVSKGLEKNLVDAEIHTQIEGSDHCPVVLFLDLDK